MHHRTPDFPWDLPGTAMFTPSPQTTELWGDEPQEMDDPPLHTEVDMTVTTTNPDIPDLTDASGQPQDLPPPIPTPPTALKVLPQYQTNTGRNQKQHSLPHFPPQGPPDALTTTADPMIQMLLQ